MLHFGTHTWLCLAFIPKGCNFITPLTLMQQFLIAQFFHLLELYSFRCQILWPILPLKKLSIRNYCKKFHSLKSFFIVFPIFWMNYFNFGFRKSNTTKLKLWCPIKRLVNFAKKRIAFFALLKIAHRAGIKSCFLAQKSWVSFRIQLVFVT